jgi:PAS domain S-box-containing protein
MKSCGGQVGGELPHRKKRDPLSCVRCTGERARREEDRLNRLTSSASSNQYSPEVSSEEQRQRFIQSRMLKRKAEHTVLVVNDVPDLLEMTSLLLRKSGYRVLTAVDGREGFEVAQAEHPDIVISDVAMPDVDGIEMCRLIRAHSDLRMTPVLLLSANRKDSESVVEGLEAGADDYLEMPYDPMRLIARIAQLIERKRTEETLFKLASIVESSDDAIIGKTLDGIITSWNKGAERIYGYGADEIIGHRISVLMPPEFQDELPRIIGKIKRGERVNHYETVRVRKDGQRLHISLTVSPIKDASGEIVSASTIARDITERKRVEEALHKSEERLQTVIESLAEGLVISELDGQLLHWNRAALEMHGFSSLEECLLHLPEFEKIYELSTLDGSRLSFNSWPLPRIIRSGCLHNLELCIRHVGNGWERVFSYGGAIVREPSGKPLAFLTITDITERKRAEEQIRQLNETLEQRVVERTTQLQAANKELEAFSYSVSHDLRAPLRHINGFSQALLEDYADNLDEEGKNYLREVRAASQEMAQLIDDVLQLARVTRSEMRREMVNLSETSRVVVAELQKGDAERAVAVHVEEGLVAQGDKRLLRIMLSNLLGNAWKFTSKREHAEIAFGQEREASGETVYFVRDNGAGFDMAYVNKLFGAFQRLHTTSEFEGTGIGLATVQRIVNRHGGRVWAEGAIGQGATFYFTLPNFKEMKHGMQSDPLG